VKGIGVVSVSHVLQLLEWAHIYNPEGFFWVISSLKIL
jgi:hypothetical protein